MKGFIQYGARSYHRCTEVIMIIRLVIEKTREWNLGCVIISVDLERAFEHIKLSKILEHWTEAGIPVRLRYAAFKEIAGQRFVN